MAKDTLMDFDKALELYEPVLGFEEHVELNTKTKMFSGAANSAHADNHGAEPNTLVAPVDMGLPGSLPTLLPTLLPGVPGLLGWVVRAPVRSWWAMVTTTLALSVTGTPAAAATPRPTSSTRASAPWCGVRSGGRASPARSAAARRHRKSRACATSPTPMPRRRCPMSTCSR